MERFAGFYNPTKIIFGKGSLAQLKEEINFYGSVKKIMLITGKRSLNESGNLQKAVKQLRDKKIYLINSVEPNPEIDFIDEVIKKARKEKIDMIIGIGGGSVLDATKAVALLKDKKFSLEDILFKNIKIEERNLPCIAIPTTAGSGSEVTKTASIWNKSSFDKLTVISDFMFPDVAIIDPDLTLLMNPYLTAVTGLDALSHAVESYWSKKSSFITQNFSKTAVRLVFANLRKAFKKPNDFEARSNMSLASLYAGLAISNTGTTACHAISYVLTVRFGIPHGLASSLSLPYIMRFNAKYSPYNLRELAEGAGFNSADQFADKIESLMKDLKFSLKLRDYGIKNADLNFILTKSNSFSNTSNNCARLTKKDLKIILERML